MIKRKKLKKLTYQTDERSREFPEAIFLEKVQAHIVGDLTNIWGGRDALVASQPPTRLQSLLTGEINSVKYDPKRKVQRFEAEGCDVVYVAYGECDHS